MNCRITPHHQAHNDVFEGAGRCAGKQATHTRPARFASRVLHPPPSPITHTHADFRSEAFELDVMTRTEDTNQARGETPEHGKIPPAYPEQAVCLTHSARVLTTEETQERD